MGEGRAARSAFVTGYNPRVPETPGRQHDEREDEGDISLIRWMLSLTPAERLEVLDRHVADVLELRERSEGSWGSKPSSRS